MSLFIGILGKFNSYATHSTHRSPPGFFQFLEELVASDDPVRFPDAFAEKLDLSKLGFKAKTIQQEGRPSFDPRILLKIYLYGYQNGIRSSRRLERNANGILKCNGYAEDWFPTTTPLPTSVKTIRSL
ncbi:MAG: transposase [Bacteroidetes bacterium]|nr:transposase [Bacteroidota bacterium]